MFLNLQGALVGVLISYVFPCMYYLRMLTYARALRAKDKEDASEGLLSLDKEAGLNESGDMRLDWMDSATKREGLKTINLKTAKLDPETRLEFAQKLLCFFVITFGIIGGTVSLVATSTHIGDNLF